MSLVFLDMDQKPHSWYIPRPSLASTKSSQHSDAVRRYHRDSEVIDIERAKRSSNCGQFSSSSSSTISSQHSKEQKISMETCIDSGGEGEVKRGSRSSQGSSDSEQSIHVSEVWCNYDLFNLLNNNFIPRAPPPSSSPSPTWKVLPKFRSTHHVFIIITRTQHSPAHVSSA